MACPNMTVIVVQKNQIYSNCYIPDTCTLGKVKSNMFNIM